MIRVLFHPAAVFREQARGAGTRRSWWPQPLGLLFAFGCFVSIAASGRLSVRLIVDGAVSFAFVVAIEIAALAVVTRTGARLRENNAGGRFPSVVDVFFLGNAPWLWWMLLVGAVLGVVPPRDLGPWFRVAIDSCLVPAAWSVWIDYHFFREVLAESPRGARRAVLVNRTIGWVGAIGIFLGIAIWSYLPGIAARVGL